ncbi:cytochrome c oxidase subunit II [Schlesneria paludicola]|uniref:cytochrome c oxidase subunit II n=1 Tax=Schlesneria paludicola TaxID=360056 RepID=UPI00029B0B4E|nr:cytochrome c oxidase subunit II [Schlesneria paludicola]
MNFMTLAADVATDGGSFWFPAPSSTIAGEIDSLFNFILSLSAFFFVLIVGLMLIFVIKYRRRPGYVQGSAPDHNDTLEIVWSVIPALLSVLIFYRGFVGYLDARTPPAETYEIKVNAKKWSWAFQYPNGYIDNDLHLPVNRAIKLTMTSEDVIHSLFIPAFRTKMDIVPGRYTTMWFNPTREGEFPLLCAEYCGTKHSDMLANVVVHPSGEFERWLEQASNLLATLPPVEAGKILYTRRGCVQCHTLDGTAKVGPSFKASFGTKQSLADGTSVEIEENYIRESILDPLKKVRAGFRPVMPSYKGQLKDPEIDAIIEFIKSLK